MSDVPARLGTDAADLLLMIAEMPDMVISGAVLYDFYPHAGRMLIDVGALKADGFETVAASQADHDDAVVHLAWSAEKGGYAYFSPGAGLVRVDDDALVRFRLTASWFLDWLGGQLGLGAVARPVCLVPDRLWDLGDAWLGERMRARRRTAIYVARRLNQPESFAQVQAALRSRSGRPVGVILTTSLDTSLARSSTISGCAVVPIRSCAQAGTADFTIDMAVVYGAAHGARPARENSPIQVEAGFRMMRVGQREFRFRGDKQRQVVEYLHDAWDRGEERVSTALMFSELEFPETTRLRDLFSKHPNWKDLIGAERGSCWLKCDELLAGSKNPSG